MKIDFVIAGAQKSGTSALDCYLRRHPDICMATNKEAHFFDAQSHFVTEHPDCAAHQAYQTYHACFPGSRFALCALRGEATPIYMYWRDAPKRMFQYNPKMKLIIALRNPIERAYSHWNMQRDRKVEKLSFHDALNLESNRRLAQLPLQERLFSYTDRGFYTKQLERIWQYFPRCQTLILRSDDIRTNHQRALNSICQFLAIPEMLIKEERIVHARPYADAMCLHDWKRLRMLFEDEIKALEQLLGWDCGGWLKPPALLRAPMNMTL